jgi:hypothetical protein
MYDSNADIASFLRKLLQNVAHSRDFPIHTMKHITLRLHKKMRENGWLKYRKSSNITFGGFWDFSPRICSVRSQYIFYDANWKKSRNSMRNVFLQML